MHVWSIAFGCIIGWGSFVNPGKKFLPNSDVAGTAIAMVLGALVMIIIAFSYAYMVQKYPKAGGEFTFTKECYGKIPAYVCGWFLVAAYLTNVPMNSTAIPLIIEGLFGDVLSRERFEPHQALKPSFLPVAANLCLKYVQYVCANLRHNRLKNTALRCFAF